MTPIEKNARKLVGVFVQHFPHGGVCEDLRRQFEQDTSLRRQSFYNALRYAKGQGWLIGGAKDRRDKNQSYNLNPDNSWKKPVTESIGEPVGEPLSRDQLEYLSDSRAQRIEELQSENERLLNWSNGGDAGVALPSLVKIVGDNTASTRQRLKAAAAFLAYKADNEATAFVRRFLESVCANADGPNIDYRIEAGELLRRHESPRVVSETIKPTYRDDVPRGEPPIPLKELVRQRRERSDRMQAEMIREYGWVDNSSGGNRSDGTDCKLSDDTSIDC